jgi:hypothetical protein
MCPLTTPVRLPRDTFICRSSMHDCGLVLTKVRNSTPGPVTSLCSTRSSRSRTEMCSSEIDPPKRRQQALNDARVARCLLCLSHLRMLLPYLIRFRKRCSARLPDSATCRDTLMLVGISMRFLLKRPGGLVTIRINSFDPGLPKTVVTRFSKAPTMW